MHADTQGITHAIAHIPTQFIIYAASQTVKHVFKAALFPPTSRCCFLASSVVLGLHEYSLQLELLRWYPAAVIRSFGDARLLNEEVAAGGPVASCCCVERTKN